MEEVFRYHRGKPVIRRIIGPGGDGLRIPSLRGVLRFWFRSMYPGKDLVEFKTEEARIFGDTAHGQGLRIIPFGQSPQDWKPIIISAKYCLTDEVLDTLKTSMGEDAGEVIPRLKQLKNRIFISKKELEKSLQKTLSRPLFKKLKREIVYQAEIIGTAAVYLGFGPLMMKSGEATSYHNSGERKAIPSGVRFYFRAYGNEQQIGVLVKCLRLLHLFGGVGSRSRRGWGSVAVEILEPVDSFLPEWKSGMNILEWFKEAFDSVWDAQTVFPDVDPPDYSAFSKNTRIFISQSSWKWAEDTYTQVFKYFYRAFRKVRIYDMSGNHPKIVQEDLAIGHDWQKNTPPNNIPSPRLWYAVCTAIQKRPVCSV